MKRIVQASGCIVFCRRQGLTSPGVDSSAIAGNRRTRRAKSDGVAVRKVVRTLLRYQHGAR